MSSGNVFASKMYTLEMLNYYKDTLLKSFVISDALVSVKDEIVGFFYEKSFGNILNGLDNIRKYSSLKDIYFGDLQECNFVVDRNKKNLFVVDLDSCKICNNVAMASRYLNRGALLTNTISKYNLNDDENVFRAKGYVYNRLKKR